MLDPKITELARILEGVPIEYCILHGWDADDSNLNSDVDIALAPKDLSAFEKALDNRSFGGIGQLLHYERTGYLFIVRLPTRHNTEFAKFDVETDYRRDRFVYLSAADLTMHRPKCPDACISTPESH